MKPNPGFSSAPWAVVVATLPELRIVKDYFAPSKKIELLSFKLFLGNRVTVAGPVLGAPQAAILLENLKVAGASHIVFLGLVGSLSPKIPLDALFLPEKAFCLEGTSKFYARDRREFFPDASLLSELRRSLEDLDLKFSSGSVVSVDSPYRMHLLKEWTGRAEAVDMETSAVFSCAEAIGLRAVALHIVSDDETKRVPMRSILRRRRESLKAIKRILTEEEV